jgi:hypothetical protein
MMIAVMVNFASRKPASVMSNEPPRSKMKANGNTRRFLGIAKSIGNWLIFYPMSKNSFGVFPDAGGAFYFPEEKTRAEPGKLTEHASLANMPPRKSEP